MTIIIQLSKTVKKIRTNSIQLRISADHNYVSFQDEFLHQSFLNVVDRIFLKFNSLLSKLHNLPTIIYNSNFHDSIKRRFEIHQELKICFVYVVIDQIFILQEIGFLKFSETGHLRGFYFPAIVPELFFDLLAPALKSQQHKPLQSINCVQFRHSFGRRHYIFALIDALTLLLFFSMFLKLSVDLTQLLHGFLESFFGKLWNFARLSILERKQTFRVFGVHYKFKLDSESPSTDIFYQQSGKNMHIHPITSQRFKKSFRNQSTLNDSQSDESECSAINAISVDYRLKSFDLMKKNAQLEVVLKQSKQDIASLEKEILELNEKMQEIFEVFGISYQSIRAPQHFEKATQQMETLLRKVYQIRFQEQTSRDSHQESVSCSCEKEYEKIIGEYKKIIETQHQKSKKNEKNFEQELQKLKEDIQKFEKDNQEARIITQTQINKLNTQIQEKNAIIQKMEEENEILFGEKQKIAQKYHKEIEHFEQMERIVEEKLLEVEREMNFYKMERVAQANKISSLEAKLGEKNRIQQNYYSFGDKQKDAEVQVDMLNEQKEEKGNRLTNWEQQCYEQSIKTLLQENKRLKNALLSLHKQQNREAISQQAKLELKILLSTLN